MKYLLPLLACLFAFGTIVPASAQKTCDLTLKDSPEIRGIKLGMHQDDLSKLLGWKTPDEPLGRAYARLSKTAGFEGIEDAYFDFYEGRLAWFQINYGRPSIKWKWNDSYEFASALSTAWNIPVELWRFQSSYVVLPCKEFEIRVEAISNRVLFIDTTALKAIEEEKRKAEEGRNRLSNLDLRLDPHRLAAFRF